MRLALVANARMPTERAHGVQLASMCAALAGEVDGVELVVPARRNHIASEVPAFYGVPATFSVRRLPTVDLVGRGEAGRHVQRMSFVAAAVARLRRHRPDLVITRDELVAGLLAPTTTSIYECHRLPLRGERVYGALVRRATGVVSTNRWKAETLVRRCGVDPGRLTVLPNATDVGRIAGARPRAGLRAALGIPPGARLVVYVGHLYEWKGTAVLARAADALPAGVHVVVVGGTDRDLARFGLAHRSARLHLVGRVPHAEVAGYLAAADVLVLPNQPTTRESVWETSPLKLFEYMASGRPIVASDLPAVREIVGDDAALLVPPGDPGALADGVGRLLADPALADRIATEARRRVQGRTWRARAKALLAFAASLPSR